MGLRMRMAISYVLVTLAAVAVVEALLIGVFTPPVIGASVAAQNQATQLDQVRASAKGMAMKLSGIASTNPPATPAPGPSSTPSGPPPSGAFAVTDGACAQRGRAGSVTLVLAPDGSVAQSSYPACYPVGGRPPAAAVSAKAVAAPAASGNDKLVDGPVVWAVEPVVQVPADEFTDQTEPTQLLSLPGAVRIGALYVQNPYEASHPGHRGSIRPLVVPGLVVLVAALPVGLLFGFISMTRPVRRLRTLAASTRAIADGDLTHRIPVHGHDELSGLEDGINRMAEQLTLALAAERDLATAGARTAERARLARELHDSVSQELFSIRVLAGGIDKALPSDSPLREQVDSLARAADTASREMRALLLELRPVALSDAGLAGALELLARAYQSRLAITIVTRLDSVTLDPDHEHALLRIAQEAVANAVRHGRAQNITLTLQAGGLSVHDDGAGFDPGAATDGMGLATMRERAAEVGSELQLTSAPGAGTNVTVPLP